MKKILLILFIVNCSLQIGYSQSGWFWLNPQPFGNEVLDIYFFDSQTGLLSLSSGSVLKTTNAGSNWNALTETPGYSLNEINFFDNTNGIAFAGNYYSSSEFIYRSTNAGNNWSSYSSYPYSVRKFFQLTLPSTCFANADNFYADIVKSTNSGLNWFTCYSDSSFLLFNFHFPSSVTGYATGMQRVDTGYVKEIIKSTNGGTSWAFLHQNFAGTPKGMYFINDNTGYVTVSVSGSSYLLYKTTNGGTGWNPVGPVPNYNDNIHFINENTGYSDIHFVTTNGGLNWQNMSFQFDINGPNKLSFAGTSVFGIGTGIITKSTNNGLNWSEITSGYHTHFDDVHFINALTGLVCGEYGKLLRTTNGGVSWNMSVVEPLFWNELSTISMPDDNNWYVGDFDLGRVLRTTNAGNSWDTTYTNGDITKLDFINAETGFGVCKYWDFLKTTNRGTNWSRSNVLNGAQNFSIDFVDENTGYTGGGITRKTTDGGNTWSVISFGIDLYTAEIQFFDANTGYMAGGINTGQYVGIIMKTTNGGLNWIRKDINDNYINDLHFVDMNTGFATSYGKMFKTTDGGVNWRNLGYAAGSFNKIYFVNSQTGYGAGPYGTIQKTTTGGEPIGIQPISNEVPNSFVLQQNYPNPFNPTTRIKFSVPQVGNGHDRSLQLRIYDITGREVATLINEQLQPRTYEVTWDGSNYSSGVYFYQLISGDYNLTKKMVLLK